MRPGCGVDMGKGEGCKLVQGKYLLTDELSRPWTRRGTWKMSVTPVETLSPAVLRRKLYYLKGWMLGRPQVFATRSKLFGCDFSYMELTQRK